MLCCLCQLSKPSFLRSVGHHFLMKLTSQGETSSGETTLAFESKFTKQIDDIRFSTQKSVTINGASGTCFHGPQILFSLASAHGIRAPLSQCRSPSLLLPCIRVVVTCRRKTTCRQRERKHVDLKHEDASRVCLWFLSAAWCDLLLATRRETHIH